MTAKDPRPFWTQHPVSAPAPVPPSELAAKAARFGTLCLGDLYRCRVASYRHLSPEERQARLDEDVRCAVGLARRAWGYALQLPEGWKPEEKQEAPAVEKLTHRRAS